MSFHPAQFSIVHKDDRREDTSFVGVRRNREAGPSLVLPPGFDNFPVSDAETVSSYFFKLFRTFRYFRKHVQDRSPDTESDFAGERGVRISVEDSEPAMLYTKIRVLEKVLERYDELRIYNILYRNRRTEEIDYAQIHRYLDQAVYQNDIPYVEEMRLSRPVLEVEVSTLVRMFCFIYSEVAPRTGKELSPEVQTEAMRFKSQHLAPDSALFGTLDAHNRTVDRLKRKLDDIDREVAYKDEDYWYFFEAVETFLYGELDEDEEGISWGITRFAPVWEDMCMVWLHQNRWEDIIYADSTRFANCRIGGHDLYVDESFDPPFTFELGGHERYMRPDIVRREKRSPLNIFDISGSHRVKVRIKEGRRNRKNRSIIKSLKRKIESKRSGGVTESTKNQKWSYKFFGIGNREVRKQILKISKEKGYEGGFVNRVIDFKCVTKITYGRSGGLGRKAKKDERKQITYEYALQLSGVSTTRSQLCIPTYFDDPPDDVGLSVDEQALHPRLQEQEIGVLQVDFDQVLQGYLQHEDVSDSRIM
jgi:hypothetical protein